MFQKINDLIFSGDQNLLSPLHQSHPLVQIKQHLLHPWRGLLSQRYLQVSEKVFVNYWQRWKWDPFEWICHPIAKLESGDLDQFPMLQWFWSNLHSSHFKTCLIGGVDNYKKGFNNPSIGGQSPIFISALSAHQLVVD